ncbi:DUF1810 domain-containing protein [Pedobacter frigiditerrae]|uniref:DUF1810 domain-containing protein n=1 Tax=Pedobacter frigiditerrae TaxID=2530452 RepID=UPI00292DB993|nr:DUF1810 domain-containing protein [Pedobacter frigiditerrae]
MANLDRFLAAQYTTFHNALLELERGKKQSHWMWYVFPQLMGLGHSETARFYGINDLSEAKEFLAHCILGNRLIGISKVLMALDQNDSLKIFGYPDQLKLQSSMTLFAHVPGADQVFRAVIKQYFNGQMDEATLKLLNEKA